MPSPYHLWSSNKLFCSAVLIFAGVFFADCYLARDAVNFDHILQTASVPTNVSNVPGVFEEDHSELLVGEVVEVDNIRPAAGPLDVVAPCYLQVGQ
ncbi:hypothetical protein BPAE_0004g00370 [Botrytis paeoniae]|uniref:Uncharacterized protein n=1 Tax=Botrytis paeoniae TaxID=278948 RepID=A0A4Z1G8Y6_9HELO|nr:hypothetical protein BPAE_0004g00370 [Botrytis paeoniae]